MSAAPFYFRNFSRWMHTHLGIAVSIAYVRFFPDLGIGAGFADASTIAWVLPSRFDRVTTALNLANPRVFRYNP